MLATGCTTTTAATFLDALPRRLNSGLLSAQMLPRQLSWLPTCRSHHLTTPQLNLLHHTLSRSLASSLSYHEGRCGRTAFASRCAVLRPQCSRVAFVPRSVLLPDLSLSLSASLSLLPCLSPSLPPSLPLPPPSLSLSQTHRHRHGYSHSHSHSHRHRHRETHTQTFPI